jgi:hypothetical protein
MLPINKHGMTTDAEPKAMTIKEQLQQGEYEVDTTKVADAILRNPLFLRNPLWLRPLTDDRDDRGDGPRAGAS